MAILPTPGGAFDLYREQIFNNPSVYNPSGSQVCTDNFHDNIVPQTPSAPNRTPITIYAGANQPPADSYHVQVKGDWNKNAWTTTFPTIPGQ